MAVQPKSLETDGLYKALLDPRGIRLTTEGLGSASGVSELGAGISYLLGLMVPFIARLRHRCRRGA